MLIYYEAIFTMEQNLRLKHLQTKQNRDINSRKQTNKIYAEKITLR